jgi:cytochrome c2
MKKILIAIVAALFATSAYANLTLAANPHNLAAGGNGACVYCHMVHNANAAGSGTAPLWARSIRTTGIIPYSSSRLTTAGNLTTTNVSLLCLSCHDGGAGLGTLWTGTTLTVVAGRTIAGRTQVGPDLRTEHPVGFTYPLNGTAAADSGLATRFAATTRGYVLYGTTFMLECASCHEPHLWSNVATDPTYKFKRQLTGGVTDFCLGCHDGK